MIVDPKCRAVRAGKAAVLGLLWLVTLPACGGPKDITTHGIGPTPDHVRAIYLEVAAQDGLGEVEPPGFIVTYQHRCPGNPQWRGCFRPHPMQVFARNCDALAHELLHAAQWVELGITDIGHERDGWARLINTTICADLGYE